MKSCSLRFLAEDLGWPACTPWHDRHHVLNRSFLKGNEEALALVEGKYAHLFIAPDICTAHNRERYADTKIGRAYLLMLHPRHLVEPALEEIAACYTGGYPELNWEGLTMPYRKWLLEKANKGREGG